MLSIVSKLIQALAAALPTLLSWWDRRQAAKAQAEAEARVADIRANPGPAWMHEFNDQTKTDAADKTGADKSDGDK